MKTNKSKIGCKRGFTLIELLVVVLIIGILAAVAVPRYRYAVDKARVLQWVLVLKSVQEAEETYYLAHGDYTVNWNQLDLNFSGKINSTKVNNNGVALNIGSVFTLAEGKQMLLQGNGNTRWASIAGNAVVATDPKLPHLGIVLFYNNQPSQSWPARKLACYSQYGDNGNSGSKKARDLCNKLTNKGPLNGFGGWWQSRIFTN